MSSTAEAQLVQRILASPGFAKSERLKSILVYICELQARGRTEDISEQQIGIHVFGRPADYNPAEDSIVRTHARLLRKKLENYFEESPQEQLCLRIPRGGYVPEFTFITPAHQPELDESANPTDEQPEVVIPAGPASLHRSHPTRTYGGIWGLIAIMALALVGGWVLRGVIATPQPVKPHPFWGRIFQKNRETLFVAADTGLVLYENTVRRTVPLAAYITRRYAEGLPASSEKSPDALYNLSMRRYTAVIDLSLMSQLTQRAECLPSQFRFRFARDLQLDNLKNSNVVLSGSAEANPWVELFQNHFNFLLKHDQETTSFAVLNAKPLPGEQAVYRSTYETGRFGSRGNAYGHIVFLPNLSGSGEVLIIEGTGSAGTEAATEYLMNEGLLNHELDRIRKADRSIPHFEMLVSTAYIGDGRVPNVQAIALRTLR